MDLTGCFYIRDESVELLLERCPFIVRLCVRNCRKLTDASLNHVIRKGSNITALDIGGCFNMTAPGFNSLATTHPNISR